MDEIKTTLTIQGSKPMRDFVTRCLVPKYVEASETRRFNSAPEFKEIIDPLNNGRYEKACQAAEKQLALTPDFDLIYYWYASALLQSKQPEKAAEMTRRGLAQAKSKYRLCEKAGEIAWRRGNLPDALFWWCQAWHCLPQGSDAIIFLYLACLAQVFHQNEISARLLEKADNLKGGQVRLNADTTSSLIKLAAMGDSAVNRYVLAQMAGRYLEFIPEAELATEDIKNLPEWEPNLVVTTNGVLEIGLIEGLIWDESLPRPSLKNVWVIPCLKIEGQRYQIRMELASKTNEHQTVRLASIPPGEYLIAYNLFVVEDETAYRARLDGCLLNLERAIGLFEAITDADGPEPEIWPGPRGGLTNDGPRSIILGNMGVSVRGKWPLAVEFIDASRPNFIEVLPGQTSHLILRTHVCG